MSEAKKQRESGSGASALLCTNASTTADATDIEERLKIMREFREKHQLPDGDVDVLVMTEEHYKALKAQCHEGQPVYREPHLGHRWALAGIPIESYGTRAECVLRAMELMDKKVRVGFVEG